MRQGRKRCVERLPTTTTEHAAARPRRRASSRIARAPRGKNGGTGEDPRNLVNSLSKGLRVLEAFSAERNEMTLSEVARPASIDPGTAFRMLNTLVMLGYVARVPGSKRFRLTLKVVDLGFHAIGRSDLRELARPILRSLVDEISEAASLGVLDGGDVLYVERVRAGLTRLGVDIRIGTLIPGGERHHRPRDPRLPAGRRPRAHSRNPAAPQRCGAAVAEQGRARAHAGAVRQRGYALQDSLFGNGLRVLAVPVLDGDGYPVAAISLAAPVMRMSMDEFRARSLEPVARGGEADRARGAGERNHLDRGLTRARKPQ